jgi:type VI secretion system secreted protein VgrG
MTRNVQLTLESGDVLDVRHFNILQSMSAAFRIDLAVRSTDDSVPLAAIVGRPASFRLKSSRNSQTWTGVVAHIAQTHVESGGLSSYSLQVVPTLWLLTQRRGHRLFQHASIPEMVQKLLAEWKLEPIVRLSHAYPKVSMRTQYGETDYDFVRRLLAEAGISFFFDAEDGKETKLVLSDTPHTLDAKHHVPYLDDVSATAEVPHVSAVNVSTKVVPSKSVVRDYDFRRPRYGLEGTKATETPAHPLLEDYRYVPGHSVADSFETNDAVGDRDGAYRHSEASSAGHAQRGVEAHEAQKTKVAFGTSLNDLEPGTVFTVVGHPHPEVANARKLLVTHSWINGDVAHEWYSGGNAVPADKPYRPSLTDLADHQVSGDVRPDPFEPLSKIVKPRIFGVQSAIVTGPPGEDIHTDEHGRVKVQFPWDREGLFDEKSSPWIRVSQPWAGAGFGTVNLPRVGQEVLVSFHDGDPDHPVITGRMYNTTSPLPYALPEHKSRTSLKSNSASGANEITMDDSHDNELLYVQAQKDLHKIVHNNELEYTQGSRHVHVDGDILLSAKGNIILQAGGELVLKGGPTVKINPSEQPPAPTRPMALSQGSLGSTGGGGS